MARGISMATRKELVDVLVKRYRAASRREKSQILDEFSAVTAYHRKHAVRVLGKPSSGSEPTAPSQRRIYHDAVREALIVVWEAADRICGKRLKVVLPEMLSAMEYHGRLSLDCEVGTKLVAASAATTIGSSVLSEQRRVLGRDHDPRRVHRSSEKSAFARSATGTMLRPASSRWTSLLTMAVQAPVAAFTRWC